MFTQLKNLILKSLVVIYLVAPQVQAQTPDIASESADNLKVEAILNEESAQDVVNWQPEAADEVQKPQTSKVTKRGGANGGGGNAKKSPSPKVKKILSYQNTVVHLAQMIVKSASLMADLADTQHPVEKFLPLFTRYSAELEDVESDGNDSDEHAYWDTEEGYAYAQSIRAKLFKSTPNIFEVIKTTNVKLQEKGCIDPVTKKIKAGSADIKSKTICLSANMIKDMARNSDALLVTTALLIHEYSHFVGFNEPEAEFLQTQVLAELVINEYTFQDFLFKYAILTRQILSYVNSAIERTRQVKTDQDLISLKESICSMRNIMFKDYLDGIGAIFYDAATTFNIELLRVQSAPFEQLRFLEWNVLKSCPGASEENLKANSTAAELEASLRAYKNYLKVLDEVVQINDMDNTKKTGLLDWDL